MPRSSSTPGSRSLVEAGAGAEANLADADYEETGATIVPDAGEALGQADVVPKVAAPEAAELDAIREGAVLIGFLSPLTNPELVKRLAERTHHLLRDGVDPAHDARAVDGRAVLAGGRGRVPRRARRRAGSSGKFFPMLITAAGTAAPSRVLVLGAGVAGLQAIAHLEAARAPSSRPTTCGPP